MSVIVSVLDHLPLPKYNLFSLLLNYMRFSQPLNIATHIHITSITLWYHLVLIFQIYSKMLQSNRHLPEAPGFCNSNGTSIWRLMKTPCDIPKRISNPEFRLTSLPTKDPSTKAESIVPGQPVFCQQCHCISIQTMCSIGRSIDQKSVSQ